MAVGPFLTHDTGFSSLLSTDDWVTDDHYAVLATTTTAPDRATWIDYADITNEHGATGNYDQALVAGEAVAINATKIRFTCDKITFGADTTITARYLYILKGTAASPVGTDEIIGHIDLDGTGNISSVSAEFSLTPSATNGLFEVERSAAPA